MTTVREAAPRWAIELYRDALTQDKAEMSAADELGDNRPGHNLTDAEWQAGVDWLNMQVIPAPEEGR